MAGVMVLLANPADPAIAGPYTRELQAAARTLGLELQILNASTERDLDAALAKLVQLRAGGLVISPGAFFSSRIEPVAAWTLRHTVPTIAHWREFAASGGLLSYGASTTETYVWQAATPAVFYGATSPPICRFSR
jgi:putative ABC transport system substrate-binding protein